MRFTLNFGIYILFSLIVSVILFAVVIPADAAVFIKKDNAVSDTGLIGYWSFDETSGTIAHDASPLGNNINVGVGPGRTAGKKSKALNFSSPAGYGAINDYAHNAAYANNFTVSFWAKPTDTLAITSESTDGVSGTANQRYIMVPQHGSASSLSGAAGVGISVGTNGVSVFEHSGGHLPSTMVYETTITDWTYITIIVENKQARLYLNGVLVHTGVTSNAENVFPGYVIGGFSYGYYKGAVDEFRIYNRILSVTEINRLYQDGQTTKVNVPIKVLKNADLVAQYTFDGSSMVGDTIYDQSASGYTATHVPAVFTQVAGSNWLVSGITEPAMDDPNYVGTYSDFGGTGQFTDFNGVYTQYTTINGQPAYKKDNSHYLYYVSDPGFGYYAWALDYQSNPNNYWGAAFLLEGWDEDLPTLPNHGSFGGGWQNYSIWGSPGYTNPTLSEQSTGVEAANTSWAVSGKLGQAMKFNGSTEYVRTNTDAFDGYQAGTIAAWIKTAAGSGGGSFVSYSARTTTAGANIAWYCAEVCKQSWQSSPANAWGDIHADTDIRDGKWHHVVFAADGTNPVKIYVDGVAQSTTFNNVGANTDWIADVNDVGSNTNTLEIGAALRDIDNTPNAYEGGFAGSIDDVRIYNRALTAQEIAQLYGKTAGTKMTVSMSQNNKITDGLVGLWSFNGQDVSGTTAYDRSGQGNNGTLTDGPKVAIGKVGQALQFNGTNYVVTDNASALNPSSAITVSTWFKQTGENPTAELGGLMSLWSNTSGRRAYVMYTLSTGNEVRWNINGPAEVAASVNLDSPVWHHVVGTYDGATVKIYVDGVLKDSTSYSGSINTNGIEGLEIGSFDQGTQFYFNGVIDESRVYNRALSATEVSQLYKLGK